MGNGGNRGSQGLDRATLPPTPSFWRFGRIEGGLSELPSDRRAQQSHQIDSHANELEGLICCTNVATSSVRFFHPGTFQEIPELQFDTPSDDELSRPPSTVWNLRVVQVPHLDDERRVIAVSGRAPGRRSVIVRDVDSQEMFCFADHRESTVSGLACLPESFSSNPSVILAGTRSGELVSFDATDGRLLFVERQIPKEVQRLRCFSPWKTELYVTSKKAGLLRFDLGGSRACLVASYPRKVRSSFWRHVTSDVAACPDRNLLFAVASASGRTLSVWDRDQPSCCAGEITVSVRLSSCRFAGSDLLVVGGDDGTIEVFDIRKASQRVSLFCTQYGHVREMLVLEDDKSVLCSSGSSILSWGLHSALISRHKIVSRSGGPGICFLKNDLWEFVKGSDHDVSERLQFLIALMAHFWKFEFHFAGGLFVRWNWIGTQEE